MPNSKRRKKQIAANRRQLEKAKRRLEILKELENETTDKENTAPSAAAAEATTLSLLEEYPAGQEPFSQEHLETTACDDGQQQAQCDSDTHKDSGWFGGIYNWCQSGLTQVSLNTSLMILY